VPVEVAGGIRQAGHDAWTAYEAHIEAFADDAVLVYAEGKHAIVVTTNKDFIPVARRMGVAQVVYVRCLEVHAVETMKRALDWLAANRLPPGRVLRVHHKGADILVGASALKVLDLGRVTRHLAGSPR
jgi:predicted nuclease of predicted toxin-antitoxin system